MRSLSLIGATGLFVPRRPIADIFMLVQARNGVDYADFRRTLFRRADAPEALAMFPDGRMPGPRELLRYRMFRFASRVGFAPPYLHDRKLLDRLHRFAGAVSGRKALLAAALTMALPDERLPSPMRRLVDQVEQAVAAEGGPPLAPFAEPPATASRVSPRVQGG